MDRKSELAKARRQYHATIREGRKLYEHDLELMRNGERSLNKYMGVYDRAIQERIAYEERIYKKYPLKKKKK